MIKRRHTPYQMQKSAEAWASQVHNNRHLEAEVEEADAHKLTLLLYTAILAHMKDALSAMQRDDQVAKVKWVNKAQTGINELRVTLRHDIEPEISMTLDSLYDYLGRQLAKAKAAKDAAPLVLECIRLLAPIKEAWEQVMDEARQFRAELATYQQEMAAKDESSS
ncbi:flagellar export chaperone FliS [Marinospirillum sp. MEB164]|uniref:Flagellar export chaperone FliS n=1 Tax=Marinospirillum alkalitolerans TaxID=3123374 RepID=A0ABW8PYK8_9GAMM